jgi:hypothetical protein
MMIDSIRVMRPPRRAWPPVARTAAAIIAVASLALLTACGGSPSAAVTGGTPNAGQSASSPSAVAYSDCMRSHGVPNYPDPGSNGALPKGSAQQFGVSSTQLQAAESDCQHLYPANDGAIQECETTGDCPQAVVQQALNIMREYAQCMRSHGVPRWPDPTLDSEGRPFFDVSAAGLSYQYTHSSLFSSKDGECERLVGGSAGVPVPLG